MGFCYSSCSFCHSPWLRVIASWTSSYTHVGWTLALGFEFVIIQESHQEDVNMVLEQIVILEVGSDSGASIATFQPYDCTIVIFKRGEVTLINSCAIRSLWSIQQRLIKKKTCIVHSDYGQLQTCNMQVERKSLGTPFTSKALWPRLKLRNTSIRASRRPLQRL
jgi:hypothetical protein